METRMKVLVVEDTEELRTLLVTILQYDGYQVESANNGVDALERLETFLPDLIISDILMPEMDGYELATIVNKKYPEIKIQLVSGDDEKSHANLVDENLKENIIYKPFNSNALLAKIRKLLDKN